MAVGETNFPLRLSRSSAQSGRPIFPPSIPPSRPSAHRHSRVGQFFLPIIGKRRRCVAHFSLHPFLSLDHWYSRVVQFFPPSLPTIGTVIKYNNQSGRGRTTLLTSNHPSVSPPPHTHTPSKTLHHSPTPNQ